MSEYPVTTICGSMRFFQQMLVVADELTRRGEIVLLPLVRKSDKANPHAFEQHTSYSTGVSPSADPTPVTDEALDAMHRAKIDKSTSIVVVSDHTGYYGESTAAEIEQAVDQYQDVRFARVKRQDYRDTIAWILRTTRRNALASPSVPTTSEESAVVEQAPINVTATDPMTGDSDTQQIWNDYCLVTAGTAEVTGIQIHAKDDGTATHVITVKGVRRG